MVTASRHSQDPRLYSIKPRIIGMKCRQRSRAQILHYGNLWMQVPSVMGKKCQGANGNTPWKDFKEGLHDELGKKMQESLLSCVAFHLLMVLRHNYWVRWRITSPTPSKNPIKCLCISSSITWSNSTVLPGSCHTSTKVPCPKANSVTYQLKVDESLQHMFYVCVNQVVEGIWSQWSLLTSLITGALFIGSW